jgi:hypothetical protein
VAAGCGIDGEDGRRDGGAATGAGAVTVTVGLGLAAAVTGLWLEETSATVSAATLADRAIGPPCSAAPFKMAVFNALLPLWSHMP